MPIKAEGNKELFEYLEESQRLAKRYNDARNEAEWTGEEPPTFDEFFEKPENRKRVRKVIKGNEKRAAKQRRKSRGNLEDSVRSKGWFD